MDTVCMAGSIQDTLTAVELSAAAVRPIGEPRTGDGDGDGDNVMIDCDDMSTVDIMDVPTDDIDDVVSDDDAEMVVIIPCDDIELIGEGVVSDEDMLVVSAAEV